MHGEKCPHVKREGESCTLNNNCTYPFCIGGEMDLLEMYGRPDHPDIHKSIVDLLKSDHIYYIDGSDDASGWFVPKRIQGLSNTEVIIHNNIKKKKEGW